MTSSKMTALKKLIEFESCISAYQEKKNKLPSVYAEG